MRIPTKKEYEMLTQVVGYDDEKVHWRDIFSWVCSAKMKNKLYVMNCSVKGYYSANHEIFAAGGYHNLDVGFRPAFSLQEVDALAPEGKLSIVGSLYMDGLPVAVPQTPMENGDVMQYQSNAKLEIRPCLGNPAYIITGYRIGDIVIADRVLLSCISCVDIVNALEKKEVA